MIQAKRYKHTVGVSAVRDLFGTVQNEGASKGILVTTSGYGSAWYDFANNKPLELLDGSNLLYLLAEHAGIEAKIEPPDDWVDPEGDVPGRDQGLQNRDGVLWRVSGVVATARFHIADTPRDDRAAMTNTHHHPRTPAAMIVPNPGTIKTIKQRPIAEPAPPQPLDPPRFAAAENTRNQPNNQTPPNTTKLPNELQHPTSNPPTSARWNLLALAPLNCPTQEGGNHGRDRWRNHYRPQPQDSRASSYMFGIVGFPVIPIAHRRPARGHQVRRHAPRAVGVLRRRRVGYLTGRPGVCLAVSGPGMTNAISGLGNALVELLADDPARRRQRTCDQNGHGRLPGGAPGRGRAALRKYAPRPDRSPRLPYYIEQAVRTSIYGRPGAAYLDLLGRRHLRHGRRGRTSSTPPRVPEPPRTMADPARCRQRARGAASRPSSPLVIVGKGAAYARAEDEVREFIEATQLPFLASPMGKGVMPDDHPLSVGAGPLATPSRTPTSSS